MASPKVEVIIEAIDKNFDKVIGKVEKLDKSVENIGSKKGLGSGFATDLVSSFKLLAGAAVTVGAVWSATMGELVEYGDQVKNLSLATGQSAEETSRQIQLADRLGVSYSTLKTSLRNATKNGIDTSTEGLIKLGEQYKALGTGAERAEFLTKKFGAAGTEMGRILEKTGDEIRKIAAETKDGFINTDKDQEALEEYKQTIDELGDSFTNLKLTFAKVLLPVFNGFTPVINANLEALMSWKDGMDEARAGGASFADWAAKIVGTNMPKFLLDMGFSAGAYAKEADGAAGATRDLGGAAESAGPSLGEMDEQLKRAAEAAKELSKTYTGLLSSMFSIQTESERAAASEQNIADKRAELAEKEKRVTLELWSARQQQGFTLAQEGRYYQELIDIQKEKLELDNMEVTAQENAAEASKKRIFDLVQQKLAADGLIESGEFDYLQNLAVSYGLVSRESANRAIADNALADQMVSNFAKTQSPMEKSLSTMQQIASFDGRFVNFGINFSSNVPGASSLPGANSLPGSGGVSTPTVRDSGGFGAAGKPYMIGTGAQPELFVPSTNGTFIPNADMGKNINISISIASVRSPSDIDYLAQEVARRVARV